MNRKPISGARRAAGAAIAALMIPLLCRCASPFERIDQHTAALLAETNETLGAETETPRLSWPEGEKAQKQRGEIAEEHPTSVNPPASALSFRPLDADDDVLERLRGYARPDSSATEMDLWDALEFATRYSREYRFAEENYVLDALSLLSERHLWGPRFFNDTFAEMAAVGDDGLYDSSVRLVNDFQVTQRLPYGGEVSARFLAALTEDLHERVAGENVQTADLILSADVPLLRGAGLVAREPLIQAERNVIYAARAFERFRREFLVDITVDFLDLVVLLQNIENTRRSVAQFEESEQRERALVEAGRQPPFNAARAAQDTLFARDGLNNQLESYRLALDRFKVRIGVPEQDRLAIIPSTIGLPVPELDLEEATRAALAYRLDLQNRRDFIDDARRGVNNARNDLLADLDLTASIALPTDDTKDRPGLDFDFEDTTYRAALALGLPLDRTVERLNLRQAQIDLERSIRGYDEFRDTVIVEVRAAVRGIDTARFSVELQQENVRIAERRVQSIEAAPDRADARDRSEAVEAELAARVDFDGAQRDLQVAILAYLLSSDQLRVDRSGGIRPLAGMAIEGEDENPDAGGRSGPEPPAPPAPPANPGQEGAEGRSFAP